MKTFIFLILIILCTGLQLNAQLKDFFPLSIGSTYRYYYSTKHSEAYISAGFTINTTVKGTVSYSITDSSKQSDSSTIWSIIEKESLLTVSHNSNYSPDSNINVTQKNLQLNESTVGRHRISITSKVWNFSGDKFNRYYDTPAEVVYFGIGEYFYFKHDSGLVSFTSFWDDGSIHSYYQSLEKLFILISKASFTTVIRQTPQGPAVFLLTQNYPNPFNSSTIIKYKLPKSGNTKLIIYNSLGKKVDILIDNFVTAGEYSIQWDATKYPSGVYFCRIQTDDYSETKKILLIK